VGQRIARVNASLASARRCAALTRAIRRPEAGSYRRARHVSATTADGVFFACLMLDRYRHFRGPHTGHDLVHSARGS
jgi:hypothetical protein